MQNINTDTHAMVKLRDLMARYNTDHDLVWARKPETNTLSLKCTTCESHFQIENYTFSVWRKYLEEDHPGIRLVNGELDFSQVDETQPTFWSADEHPPKDAEPENEPGMYTNVVLLDIASMHPPKDDEPENEPAGYYDPDLANELFDELKELKGRRKTLRKLTFDNEYEIEIMKEHLRENGRRPSAPLDTPMLEIFDELAGANPPRHPFSRLVIGKDEARSLGLL